MEGVNEWYIELGKQFVKEGLRPQLGMTVLALENGAPIKIIGEWDGWNHCVPDCRNRFTQKMIEMHIENLALETYGEAFEEIQFTNGDRNGVIVVLDKHLNQLLQEDGSIPYHYLKAIMRMNAAGTTKGPYELKTNPGDRFVVPARYIVGKMPDNPAAAGLVALGEHIPVLLEARCVREDDIWECYPITPAPEGFTALGLDKDWLAKLQTDGEVQRHMESELTKEWKSKL